MNPLRKPQVKAATLTLAWAVLLSGSRAQSVAPGDTPGVPWTGQPGITETVDQIMAREAQSSEAGRSAQPRETHPRFVPQRAMQHNPQSLLEPNWRAKGTRRTPGPLAPQVLGTNFLGAQISDTIGYIPPDSMGAVGPSQVLVVVNGRIKVFDKSGNLGPLSATTDAFFSSVRSASTSDPHARYDRLTQRWFISMIDVANVNRVLLAVSSGPVITGTSSFTFFQFENDLVGPTPNPDTGNFADYDTLGVDRYALYIGVNMFNSAGTRFLGTTGFVINKSNLLSGTLTVTPFRQMATATGAGPYTPQGVANDDPNATEGYFIGVDNAVFSQLDVRRISNPGGTPSISGNLTITTPATVSPISQVHKGNTLNKNLDALDIRLFAAAIHVDKITGTNTLWTAHNIEVDTNGVAFSGSGGRNGSRWYQIGNLNTSPALIQSGTLFDPAVTNTRGFWIPSVAASGQGHMALGCSYAGTNDFAGCATAGRLRTDALGSIQAPSLAVVSSTAYNISETPNPHRWGDFSQVVLDPNDDMTFWTFQEYCNAANSWGVRAIQLTAPPPTTPASASPASLAQGQTAANVVITGTSSSGSEFFDPGPDTGGPGFSNRIAAAVNGGGVTVNSVTFSNPTNITINVTVQASATPGARTITVTNPDGQATTSVAGILTITGSGTTTANFTGGPTNGVAPLTVTFTNLSSGATNYSWAFGDGNGSSNTNASNTYTNPGTYSVTLTAVGVGGTNVLTRTNYIVVVAPVVAGFTGGPTNGLAPLTVTFTNLSSGATNYSWAFGDGNLSSNANPTNTYSSAGTYSVTLTAIGPGGTNTFARTNYVVVLAPVVAGFTGRPTNGVAPLTVTFTNLSSGATNYSWVFGDGHLSSNTNASNTYSNAGTYSVTLTAIGPGGTNVLTRTNYIVVVAPVVAGFTGGPTNGLAPLTVTFTNLSSGATNYSWVFGDGHLSSNTNTSNTYSNAGTYSVTLTAVGPGGTNALTRTNYIVVVAPVVADFTGGPTNGVAPLTVTFTNLSSGATNYSWAFGDGHLSSNTNASNTYSGAGTYSVTLTAVGPGGTNTFTRTNYIVVVAPVVADFTGGPTNGLAPLTVTFTNLSSGATNYSWAFGDGHLSSNTNASNTYSSAGTYSVTLTAIGAGGTNVLTRTNYIIVVAPVVADFTGGPTNGVAPLTVTFTNLSSGATNYSWAFGDGHLSSNTNASNTYSNAGTYSVTLTAVGPGGTNMFTRTNYIVVVAPVLADFTGGPTNGVAPLTVTFTNLSSGATNYSWAFGDGHLSSNTNASNTYSSAGTYSVTLTAVGPGGTNTFTRTNYIGVVAPVAADFTGGPTNGVAPLTVTFTNLSSGATNYSWAFGDGNLSTDANPTNTYSSAGAYSVTLTAVGAGGTNALTLTNYIVVVTPVVAEFTAGPTNGLAPLTVTFTNLSSGATSYSWAFGDGNLSTDANPTNIYSNAGTYSVTLTAVGAGGTNVLTLTNYIVVVAPVVADFTAGPTNGVAPLTVTFTNLSSGATNYSWAFGDGNLSTDANPTNTYSSAGTYSVTLTAIGPGGTNALTLTNYIVVVAPVVADFTAGPTNGVAPLTVTFTNLSSGATSYSWAFGDGNLSTDANPTNIYSSSGAYSVTLTAVGAGGTNTLTRTNYIVVTLPTDLLLVNPLMSLNQTFQFAVSNADGTPISTAQQSNIEIHASANLSLPFTNWSVLTNATLLTNGVLQVTDPSSPLSAQRFYRAVQRP